MTNKEIRGVAMVFVMLLLLFGTMAMKNKHTGNSQLVSESDILITATATVNPAPAARTWQEYEALTKELNACNGGYSDCRLTVQQRMLPILEDLAGATTDAKYKALPVLSWKQNNIAHILFTSFTKDNMYYETLDQYSKLSAKDRRAAVTTYRKSLVGNTTLHSARNYIAAAILTQYKIPSEHRDADWKAREKVLKSNYEAIVHTYSFINN